MPDTQWPLLAVSVLNWNTPEASLACVASVYASSYPSFRVILVDNASTDDSVARISAAFPALTCIVNRDNAGFALGHAAALEQARAWGAAAVLLLNSDAELEAQALHALVAAWREHGSAIYGAAPLCRRGNAIVLNFPDKYLQPQGRPRAWRRDRAVIWNAVWNRAPALRVGAAPGSCLLLPMDLVDEHGWLDAAWFLYCEEIDYCYRLRAAGVASYLVPRARLWHVGGGSHRATPALQDCVHYYRTRNEIELARRYAGRWVSAQVLGKKLARGLWLLLQRPQRARRVFEGTWDAVRGRLGKTLAPEAALAGGAVVAGEAGSAAASAVRKAVTTAARNLRRVGAALLRRVPWRGPRANSAADALIREPAGPSWLVYVAQPAPFLREYHDYCVMLLRRALQRRALAICLLLDTAADNDTTSSDAGADTGCEALPRRRIRFQWEHTLVRPGGRDSADAPSGSVPTGRGEETYLVRIAGLDRLRRADAVIDYSRQNLVHIAAGGHHADYLARCVAIAPLLYTPDFSTAGRSLDLITTFADPHQPRRAALLREARISGLPLRNIRGIWDGPGVSALYCSCRILLNVHQTDDHHTLEELRVLPALLKGVIVISEDVPLRETVPYHEFIIWATHGQLLETARAVLADYAAQQARIFGDGRLARVVDQLAADNALAVEQLLRSLD